jgi:hypothetical protein
MNYAQHKKNPPQGLGGILRRNYKDKTTRIKLKEQTNERIC